MGVDDVDAVTLMPLETPVLKVSRPVAACSRCRNAKIKCDGKLPACSSCEKNGRAAECTSTNDQFARGKERSYVSTLETRIDRLQVKLEEAHARKPSVVSIPDDETAVSSRRHSYGVQEPPTPTTSKSLRRKEASAIDDLVSDFGYLSVNATARDFYGFTSAMSYARLILSACSKDQLPQETTKALPPRYATNAMIQHYLTNVFVLLPVFEEAGFYASVDTLYSRASHKAEPIDHWMVRMVLAISSASMSERRGDQRYMEGIGHLCAALEHSEAVLHPGAICSVQALVLLTEYAMLDPHHLDSWNLIGAASRAMIDLGLHQDPPKGTEMSKTKLELRRRVFHCVYALDRSTSLVQTRAFSFSDDSAKVKIPFSKAPPNVPTTSNGHGLQNAWWQSHEQALDLIHIRQLQSTWYTDMFQSGRSRWEEPYTYVWSTCDAMRRWFEGLSTSTSPNMRAFFELDLLYSYVYVLSPSPRVPAISPFAAKLIFEYCIRYGELTLRLISDPSYTAPLTFYDAMRAYMTGRQFLDVLHHNTDTLLSGLIPPHPEVKPTTVPPPALPVVPLPPNDSLQHFNTVRSIQCIKQITECLSRFGLRWGYMSWNQRFQEETGMMLENLDQRLRSLSEMVGVRRPSAWTQTSSTGSVHSSNGGSIAYQSPQSLPPGPAAYRQPSVTSHHMTSYGEPGQVHQASPPQYYHQLDPLPQQPVQPYQQLSQHPSGQSFGFAGQQSAQQFQYPAPSAPPSQQFASWAGYGGPPAADTSDQENAATVIDLHAQFPWLSDSSPEISPEFEVPHVLRMRMANVLGSHNVPGTQRRDPYALQPEQPTLQDEASGEESDESDGLFIAGHRSRETRRPSNLIQARQRQLVLPLPREASSQELAPAPLEEQSEEISSDDSSGLYIRGHRGGASRAPAAPSQSPSRVAIGAERGRLVGSQGISGWLQDVRTPSESPQFGGIIYFSTPPIMTGIGLNSATAPMHGRPTMQDFAFEYSQTVRDPEPLAVVATAAQQRHRISEHARLFRPPKSRRLDGSRRPVNTESRFAGDDGYFHEDEYSGFTTLTPVGTGLGYLCNTCSLVVQQPLNHSTDGRWCFNAAYNPLTMQPQPDAGGPAPAPEGVDVEKARQQALAGRIERHDFEPYYNQLFDYDRMSRQWR
ncbi:hypothetical protein LTR08_005892 [Meristemomyces frigidus]|nr:hypothetical protein LTR08_005892 [Meristemomyces frigidus]